VGGGVTGSPLASERVPHEGERVAVERFHHGPSRIAPVPHASRRRRSSERTTRCACPLGARWGHAGGYGGDEVGPW
jgi:hypothetical protein